MKLKLIKKNDDLEVVVDDPGRGGGGQHEQRDHTDLYRPVEIIGKVIVIQSLGHPFFTRNFIGGIGIGMTNS